MATSPTSVRFSDTIGGWLAEFSAVSMLGMGLGGTASAAIETLVSICDMELRRIPLSAEEAGLLADVLGGMLQPGIGVIAAAALADATDGFDPLGHVMATQHEQLHDLPEGQVGRLRARLLALGPAADFALRLAIARWWHRELPADVDGFRAAGLRII